MAEGSSGKIRRVATSSEIDWICHLPTEVLAYILSYMPTKDAVKTSVLSKRWKYVYTQVPSIDFTGLVNMEFNKKVRRKLEFIDPVSCERKKNNLIGFLNCVTNLNTVRSLKLLDLKCYEGLSRSIWETSLNTLLDREFVEINLSTLLSPIKLPVNVFESKHLAVLRLGHFDVRIPENVDIPSLKTLRLSFVKFSGGDSLILFSSSCPSLQDICIHRCWGFKNFVVSLSSLKKLEYETVMFQEVIIEAPKLEHLHLVGVIRCKVSSRIESLGEALLDTAYPKYYGREGIAELMANICSAKTLILGTYIMEALEGVSSLPDLPNLTSLTVLLNECRWYSVLLLLHCSPCLVTCDVRFVTTVPMNRRTLPVDTPRCLSVSLNKVEIYLYYGTEEEIQVVEYFLKNATLLKEMIICISSLHVDWQLNDLGTRLSNFPVGSSCCNISLREDPTVAPLQGTMIVIDPISDEDNSLSSDEDDTSSDGDDTLSDGE